MSGSGERTEKELLRENTVVDLGDDLLQTRTVQYSPSTPAAKKTEAPESVDELLMNAKILISEGFLDEAKATLRRILRMEPGSPTARERLEEIQKIEIKRLLGQEENPRASLLKSKKNPGDAKEETQDAALSSLEEIVGTSRRAEEEFFPEALDLEIFLAGLEKLSLGATAQDRIDLGVGFLEMELYEVAIRQFSIAAREEKWERKARALLATALVAQGKGFEAMMEIESLVADQAIPAEEKIDFGYLAGRAQEILKNHSTAAYWYRAVTEIDPQYRDAQERLVNNLKKCRNTPSSSSSPSSRS